MVKTRAIILGAGYRGRAYASFAQEYPDKLEIVAVADKLASDTIPASLYYDDWRDALASNIPAELVIVALPDALHYEATLAALEAGYHVLCEKPLVRAKEEAERLQRAQAESSRLVMVGYELRFSRYFSEIKAVIDSGAIGQVVSIAQQESIGFEKAAHSFVRGALNSAAKSSPLLIGKCSHDLDLFLWWMNGKNVVASSSFASRRYFRAENAPEDASEFCRDCPHIDECLWSAKKRYLESEALHYLFADRSEEAMRKVANTAPYGRCVWKCDNDVVDRQTVSLEFEGGAIANLMISAFTCENRRRTMITGTEGEILGDGEKVTALRFDGKTVEIEEKVETNSSRHDGGDYNLLSETLRLIEIGQPSEYTEILDFALRSHLLAFEIERAREA